MYLEKEDFPVVHEILDDDTKLGFRFIWEYNADEECLLCHVPLWNVQIRVRSLNNAVACWAVDFNGAYDFSPIPDVWDLLSDIERKASRSLARFLFNNTNLIDLIEGDGVNALADTLIPPT